MLGRIIGLLLGLGLGGFAYAILNPGGLQGQIPVLDLGAFESVRLGVAMASGALGAALVIAALVRTPNRRKPAHSRPLAGFTFADDPVDAKEAALPEEPRPFPGLTPLQALEAAPLPEPASFPAEVTHPQTETQLAAPLSAITAATPLEAHEATATERAPQEMAQPEPPPLEPDHVTTAHVATAPAEPSMVVDDFDAARAELRTHARAEAWGPAALALQRVKALASSDRQQMLAAQDAGDFARAQGRSDDAIEAYDLALAYARQAGEPDLMADALLNVGDTAYEEHRLDSAVESYESALDLRRKIAGTDHTPGAQRALSIALERLADAREDRGHRTRALDLYRESEAIAAELAATDAAKYGDDLAATRERLQELEARVLA